MHSLTDIVDGWVFVRYDIVLDSSECSCSCSTFEKIKNQIRTCVSIFATPKHLESSQF